MTVCLFVSLLCKLSETLLYTVVGINFTLSLVFRDLLRKANEKLSQVLVDVLKTTAAAEETMGLHMQSLHHASSGAQQAALPHSTSQGSTWQRVNTQPGGPYTAGKYHKALGIV